MRILIKNGRVLNPATNLDEITDILIKDDKIIAIETRITENTDKVIDASGKFVMPGFIDLHVHFRDPGFTYKEDIFTGMKAAANGGFTTVFTMPNTNPVADNADVVKYVHNKAKEGKCINVYQIGAITKNQEGNVLADIENMIKSGCLAISEDGKSVMNANLYREAMRIAAKLDVPILAHCEDINLANGGYVNADAKTEEMGLPGITNSVEDVIIARDILIAKETGARLHLCHCSTADSVKMVKAAKEEGLLVSAEVCPHHFILTSNDIDITNTNYKMNPPLRTRKDVDALKEGLRNGIIDVISTDHAPHTAEEKNTTFQKAPFGIVGLETSASLTYSELVLNKYLTPLQMAAIMSYNPAKIMKIDKGDIQVGKIADIVIFDPNITYTIDKTTFASKSKNTPFHNRKVTGKVIYTICNGNIIFANR